jgi:hypothetical protein
MYELNLLASGATGKVACCATVAFVTQLAQVDELLWQRFIRHTVAPFQRTFIVMV